MEHKTESLAEDLNQQIELFHRDNPQLTVYRSRSGRVDVNDIFRGGRSFYAMIYYYPPVEGRQEALTLVVRSSAKDLANTVYIKIEPAENRENEYQVSIKNMGVTQFTASEAILSVVRGLEMFRSYDNAWVPAQLDGYLQRRHQPFITDEIYKEIIHASRLEKGDDWTGIASNLGRVLNQEGMHKTSLTGFPVHMLRILQDSGIKRWFSENPDSLSRGSV